MKSSGSSSHEKLEGLYADGKISEENYLRLSRAMTLPSEHCVADRERGTERGRLQKGWEHGLIGGLCAGYARYFGLDDRLARTVLVGVFFLLCAFWGIGLVIIPLYVTLCLFLPWDEEEKATAFLSRGCPRLFTGLVACLFFLFPALYAVLVLPGLETMYSEMGIKIWSSEFQSTLAGRAIDCVSEYRYWLRLNDGVFLFGVGFSVMMTFFVAVLYRIMCRAGLRKNYSLFAVALGLAWTLFLVGGTLYPLLRSVEAIGNVS